MPRKISINDVKNKIDSDIKKLFENFNAEIRNEAKKIIEVLGDADILLTDSAKRFAEIQKVFEKMPEATSKDKKKFDWALKDLQAVSVGHMEMLNMATDVQSSTIKALQEFQSSIDALQKMISKKFSSVNKSIISAQVFQKLLQN